MGHHNYAITGFLPQGENVRSDWTTDITRTAVHTPTVSSRTCRLFMNYEARGSCLRTTKKYKYEASIVIINIPLLIIYDTFDSVTSACLLKMNFRSDWHNN